MFKALRYLIFGEERNSQGPNWNTFLDRFKHALSPSYEQTVKELLMHGHTAARLGNKEGYAGDVREEVMPATHQIFEGFLDNMLGWKSISYLIELEGVLIKEGCRIHPLGAMPKLDDRRRPRINPKTRLEKLITIHDCTDDGAVGAHNTGSWSYRAAKQLTKDGSLKKPCQWEL